MNFAVAQDMRQSSHAFCSVVWPRIGCYLGGGRYFTTEGTDNELYDALDAHAGIDGFQVTPEGEVRSIGSRVQFGDSAYDTFTVRASRDSGAMTELEKRLHAIEDHKRANGPAPVYPGVTIQAYVRRLGDGEFEFLSAAAIDTIDLFRFILLGAKHLPERKRTSNAAFEHISWCLLETHAYLVLGYRPRVFVVVTPGGANLPFGQDMKRGETAEKLHALRAATVRTIR